MRSAIFSCKGLGDGLISLILSNNLLINGHEATLFHPMLDQLTPLFPNHQFEKKYPSYEELFATFDQIFVSYDATSSYLMNLIKKGKKERKNLFVLNPMPNRKLSWPYFEDALFDPNFCMTKNMHKFCKNVLKLEKTTEKNGLQKPQIEKESNLILIHPTSAKEGKNWDPLKFVKVAIQLKKMGYDPEFVMHKQETAAWSFLSNYSLDVRSFTDLYELALYVSKAKLLIGNDSGIGHLASNLDVPTVTLFRHYRSANLWRPGWTEGAALYPPKWIPNLSFYRLRDKKWRSFIFPDSVIQSSLNLLALENI